MAIRAALLVAALMVATGAHAQNKVCVLPARIQSGSASVGGKITQPVDADLKPSGNTPFSGNINIVFPQGENPSDSVQKAVRRLQQPPARRVSEPACVGRRRRRPCARAPPGAAPKPRPTVELAAPRSRCHHQPLPAPHPTQAPARMPSRCPAR
jgi:hypothetical protein